MGFYSRFYSLTMYIKFRMPTLPCIKTPQKKKKDLDSIEAKEKLGESVRRSRQPGQQSGNQVNVAFICY